MPAPIERHFPPVHWSSDEGTVADAWRSLLPSQRVVLVVGAVLSLMVLGLVAFGLASFVVGVLS